MSKTFRLRKSVLYMGICFSVLFFIAAVLNASIFWLDNPQKYGFENEHSIAVVGGLGSFVWSVMLLLSLYMIATYMIERITIADCTISVTSMFQNRRFSIIDVDQLMWRVFPVNGSMVIKGIQSKATVEFGAYSKSDILQIIRLMRKLVPGDKQVGWPKFCHKIALPLRDGEPDVIREDPSFRTVNITRRRYDRFFLVMTLISAIHGLIWSVLLSSWEILTLLPIVLLSWLVLRFTIPITGVIDAEPRSSNKKRAGIVCLAVICLSPFAFLPIFWNVDGRIFLGIFGFLFLGGMFGMMFFLGERKVKSKKAMREVHQRALAEWDEGERSLNSAPTTHG